jgi:hypothetical protein
VKNGKQKELDVDFIGGQIPLTKEEQQKISEYFKTQKQKKIKTRSPAIKTLQRRKSHA